MSLHYPGMCKVCGRSVPAGATAFWDAATRAITCDAMDCAERDGLTTNKPLTGPWDTRTDTRVLADHRIGAAAPIAHVAPKRVHTIRLNSGAVLSVNARGRCEDSPSCGCCS
jgi:hypothetical protein